MHESARVVFIVVSSLEVVSGVIGNWLLLTVLLTRRSLAVRSFHNLFIANLALADLLSLGYWMTYFVLDLILKCHPVVNDAHCKLNAFIICTCTALYARFFTLHRIIFYTLMSWVLGALFAVPPLFGFGSYNYNKVFHFCSYSRYDGHPYPKVIVMTFCIVPMCLVGYWNFAIFRYWKKASLDVKSRFPLIKRRRKGGSIWMRVMLKSRTRHAEPKSTNDTVSKGTGGVKSVIETKKKADRESTLTQSESGNCGSMSPKTRKYRRGGNGALQAKEDVSEEMTDYKATTVPRTKNRVNQEGGLLSRSLEQLQRKEQEIPQDHPQASVHDFSATSSSVPSSALKRLRRRVQKERAREEAFLRSLFIVFLLMAVSFLPYAVVLALDASIGPLLPEVAIPSSLLLLFNCAANWIVYGVMNRSFRRGYVKRVKCVLGTCCKRTCPGLLGEDLNVSMTSIMTGSTARVDGGEPSVTAQELSSQV
nr:hypothetical protein BaRGS_022731 [Batillaria attramentaria]